MVLKGSLAKEQNLKEFTYTAIMSMTAEQKKALPDHVRLRINTTKKAKKFVAKSSTDQKRELFSYLNLSSFFIVGPAGIRGNTAFIELIEKFKNDDIVGGIRQAANSGIFVTADKEFVFALGQMSHATAGVPYIQELELKRAATLFKTWEKSIDEDDDSGAMDIANFLLSAGLSWQKAKLSTDLTDQHFMVLLYLYVRRLSYVQRKQINEYFNGIIPYKRMPSVYRTLLVGKYIQPHIDYRKESYTITQLGIRTVCQFRNSVLKSSNF